jgi:hypothetical protein
LIHLHHPIASLDRHEIMKLFGALSDSIRGARGTFDYEDCSGGVEITRYKGHNERVEFPAMIDGKPVIGVRTNVFYCGKAWETKTPINCVVIPDVPIRLPDSLFTGCNELWSVVLGDGIAEVPTGLCYGCEHLRMVCMGKSLTSIGSLAFHRCKELRSVDLDGCQGGVTIPNGITNIGYRAFEDCAILSRVSIAETVRNLGSAAFKNCSKLTEVRIAEGLNTIEKNVFENCITLNRIRVPKSVRKLDDYAFAGCKDLEEIIFEGNPPELGNLVFAGAEKAIVHYLPGTTGWGATFGNRPTAIKQAQAPTETTTRPRHD